MIDVSSRSLMWPLTVLVLGGLIMAAVVGDRSRSHGPPPLKRIWIGGFESGDLGEYQDAPWNLADNGPPVVVRVPRRSGSFAAQFDLPGGSQRQELVPATMRGDPIRFSEGQDRYFKFSTLFGNEWPVVKSWQLVAQWKDDGDGSPPVAMFVGSWGSGRIKIAAAGWPGGGSREAHDLGPLVRGRWIDWLVRIRFSTRQGKARVEVWRDGVRRTSVQGWRPSFNGERSGTQGATLRAGRVSYLKTGIYRDPAIRPAARVWMDAWTIARRK
jgi:hypothetical protein